MESTALFQPNYEADTRIVINQGGRWSSKTITIFQVLATRAIENPKSLTTIAGHLWPTLKKGAIRDWEMVVEDPEISSWLKSVSIGSHSWKWKNGSVTEFAIFMDEKSARASGKRDFLFLNEADGMSYPVAKQLMLGTRNQIFIDFNPVSDFWCHKYLLGDPRATWLYSNYRHNRFCPKEVIADIEELRQTDPELYKIMGLGVRGKITGMIFPHFEECDHIDYHPNEVICIDIGFSNSFTSVNRLLGFGKHLYAQELIYQRGLIDSDLIDKLEEAGVSKTSPMVIDSANAMTIAALKKAGYNAFPCKKGNIAEEVKKMKGYTWHISRTSPNVKYEWQNMVYAKNKDGELLNIPAKGSWLRDHAFDSLKYGTLYLTGEFGVLPAML